MSEDTDVGSIDHFRLEQFEIADVGVAAFELDHVSYLLHFEVNERSISIALGVDKSKNVVTFLPSVLLRKPSAKQLAPRFPRNKKDHLGLSGQKKRPKPRKTAGSIWRPQGTRHALLPSRKEHP